MVYVPLFLCLVSISVVFAQLGNFGQSQFGQGDPFNNFNRPSRVSHRKQQTLFEQQQDQATGNAAAAGNAGAQGDGSAASINQANHQATKDQTASNSLSANTATGFNPTAGGAAQAGGSVGSQRIRQTGFGSQFDRLNFRRKRQFGGFGYGMGSGAQGNSIGGGSALLGNVYTQNTGFSQASPFGASGFGAGSAGGSGYGVNIFNAANSNAFSGRR